MIIKAMNENRKNDYDLIIAGGGMIGSSLAIALQPLNLRIAVIEPVPHRAVDQPSFDDRSTALSRSTQRMFEAIGLWPEVKAAATPIHHIHVSDRGRFGFSHIDAEEQKVEALGYVVINRVLGNVLHGFLANCAGVDWICPARIVSVMRSDDSIRATLESEQGIREIQGRLLVAADGAGSSVRDMVGISASHVSYDQHAVIGNLLTTFPINNTAYERFTESGPLAFLPIDDGRSAFIWTLSAKRAAEVLALDDESFSARLHETFGTRLGEFSKIGKRAAYPLALTKANGLISNRAVLVGNAAHGLHPVAAQGFNLGLRDVASICDCLFDAQRAAIRNGTTFDPGDPMILERFANWRRSDQGKLVTFTDGLVRLFGSRSRTLGFARNIGMLGFDLIPGVRRMFARHTMGLAGRLPRLSRGVPLR